MTKRASLTPKERRQMWAKQSGECAECGNPLIWTSCIAEHTHPVALGNYAKPDSLLCEYCAGRKTNGHKGTTYGSDSHEIAKAKRLEGERLVREGVAPQHLTLQQQKAFQRALRNSVKKIAKGKQIASRGFDKRFKKRLDGTVVKR